MNKLYSIGSERTIFAIFDLYTLLHDFPQLNNMTSNNRITLTRLSHVVYQHPDIEVFKSFASDFGFEKTDIQPEKDAVLFRGYGKDQYVYVAHQAPAGESKKFIGGGFVAQSREDFEKACQMATAEVVDVSAWPGAGKMVKLRDPNGYEMRILWDQEERTPPAQGISVIEGGRATLNGALDKPRKGERRSDDHSFSSRWTR